MKINVLIIDSDIEVSKQIKYALQNENIHVYYAISVCDALHRFAKQRYEMVIMDIVHDEINGLDLIQKLHTTVLFRLLCCPQLLYGGGLRIKAQNHRVYWGDALVDLSHDLKIRQRQLTPKLGCRLLF